MKPTEMLLNRRSTFHGGSVVAVMSAVGAELTCCMHDWIFDDIADAALLDGLDIDDG